MQTFNLDISQKSIVPLLYVKQRDVGKKIFISLTDDHTPYIIPDGTQFSVWFSGKSGEGNYTEIDGESAFDFQENTVIVELIYQMLKNPGEHVMCIVMNDRSGKQIGLWNIPYFVEAIPGADSEAAQAYYQAFLQAQEKAEDAAQRAEEAVEYAYIEIEQLKNQALNASHNADLAADRAEEAADRAEAAGGGGSAVLYSPQILTNEQQSQARENIGAGSAKDVSNLKTYVTPEMFGAKGDGVTDDTQAIQAAFDNANGKSVALFQTYKVSDTITVTTNVLLYGKIDFYGTGDCLSITNKDALNVIGDGTITVKSADFTGSLVNIKNGSRRITVRLNLVGYRLRNPIGKAVSLTADNGGQGGGANTDAVAFCDIDIKASGFEYGIFVNTRDSWITCNKFGTFINYCTFGIYIDGPYEGCDNRIHLNGQSAYKIDGVNGCAIYLGVEAHGNIIEMQTMDVGREGYSDKNAIIYSSGNIITAYLDDKAFNAIDDYGNNTYTQDAKTIGIADSVLCNIDNTICTYEVIGNATNVRTNLFKYPKENSTSTEMLGYTAQASTDGVRVTIDLSDNPITLSSVRFWNSVNGIPANVKISLTTAYGTETRDINGRRLSGQKTINLHQLFTWKAWTSVTQIVMEFTGSCDEGVENSYPTRAYVSFCAFSSDNTAFQPYGFLQQLPKAVISALPVYSGEVEEV